MVSRSVLITRLSAQTAALRHALSASPPVRSLPIPWLLDDTCGTLLQFWNISCAVAVGGEADMAETGWKRPPRLAASAVRDCEPWELGVAPCDRFLAAAPQAIAK